jgi:hypothetical protein
LALNLNGVLGELASAEMGASRNQNIASLSPASLRDQNYERSRNDKQGQGGINPPRSRGSANPARTRKVWYRSAVPKFTGPLELSNISILLSYMGRHRIRHYGLFAGTVRAHNIERVRQLLAAPKPRPAEADSDTETPSPAHRCPCCGGRMIIVETFEGVRPARSPSPTRIGIDTS